MIASYPQIFAILNPVASNEALVAVTLPAQDRLPCPTHASIARYPDWYFYFRTIRRTGIAPSRGIFHSHSDGKYITAIGMSSTSVKVFDSKEGKV